jgi:hypothetical protein
MNKVIHCYLNDCDFANFRKKSSCEDCPGCEIGDDTLYLVEALRQKFIEKNELPIHHHDYNDENNGEFHKEI